MDVPLPFSFIERAYMTETNPSHFFGQERNWLSKKTFARLMSQYIANPKSSDSKTNAAVSKPKAHYKTFIDIATYHDIKRVLRVGCL